METMKPETRPSVARMLGKCSAKVVAATPARKVLMAVGALATLTLLALASSAALGSTKKAPQPSSNPNITLTEVVHQQGPRSHRMVPFTVTKSGQVMIEVNVSYEGEADLIVVPGWQRANVYATLSTPLWGPGYTYFPGLSTNDIVGTKQIRGQLEAGEYCAVLLNKHWINGIETKTVVLQNN